MDDYRQFWLINSLGNKFSFNDEEKKVFLSNPTGFGFSRNYTTEQVGATELLTSQQFKLKDITGDLMFYSDSNGTNYQRYQDFIQFVKYKPLEFHYKTPNNLDSYYCDVLFTAANKGEAEENGALTVNVTFHCLTPWLTDSDYTITLTNEPSLDGKYYELVRPYHYSGTNLSNTIINNTGTDDVGFVLKIDGTCQNPMFSLNQNGEQYGVCKITGTYDFIMIDSVEKTEQIYLENGGTVISNPASYQDFTVSNGESYLTWCKFKVGQTIFSFTCGNIDTFDGSITISFKNSYISV